jgi:hypothetical protein
MGALKAARPALPQRIVTPTVLPSLARMTATICVGVVLKFASKS